VPTATSTAPGSTTVPVATVGADGLAVAPAGAPPQIVALIAAGNAIAALPYKYGGGHKDFEDTAYDCSGSVSFALHGADLLDATLDSTGLSRWGGSRRVDHDLRQQDPHLPRRRRPALRHQRPAEGRHPLAGRTAQQPRVQGAAPRRVLTVRLLADEQLAALALLARP
jgi:hypothetical protein